MKKTKHIRGACLAGGAAIMALGAAADANAGGFAVREQSAQFQGSSWAGNAAGGGLSSMFWNPAATASLNGTNVESVATFIVPDSSITATGGAFVNGAAPKFPFNPALGGSPGVTPLSVTTTEVGPDAWVPASYMNYQVNDRLYVGLAMNSPFGFTTKPENRNFAGTPLAATSRIFSIDINPTLAYKLTPQLTLGLGAQIEYFKVRLTSGPLQGSAALGSPTIVTGREVEGFDWTYGATAGFIWQPTARTTIGLGYRSPLEIDTDAKLGGTGITTLAVGNLNPAGGKGNVQFVLPETVTLSGRQALTERLDLLGTVEWTKHSRLGTILVNSTTTGKPIDEIPANFKDGWLYSIGGEYKYSPSLTLRTGVAYEQAPVTDTNRKVFLPDSDRVWVSAGATYRYSDRITVDLAYSHLFFDEGKLQTIAAAPFGTLLTGNTDTSIDIFSLGLKYKLAGGVESLESYKK